MIAHRTCVHIRIDFSTFAWLLQISVLIEGEKDEIKICYARSIRHLIKWQQMCDTGLFVPVSNLYIMAIHTKKYIRINYRYLNSSFKYVMLAVGFSITVLKYSL